MSTTIENSYSNKRKFISDDEGYPSSIRILSITNQIEVSCNTKKIKSIEPERSSSLAIADVDDDMMVCENSTLNINDIHKTEDLSNKSSMAVSIPQHCNNICNADASPTTLVIRCYCDPYRLNALIPYHSDIY